MKIGFVFTNYNNSHFTRSAVESIARNPDWNKCRIVIVDNKSVLEDQLELKHLCSKFPSVKLIFNDENSGYFKGLNIGIKFLRDNNENLEIIIIGNNDLIFPDDFTDKINQNINILYKYPVVSPDLVTLDGIHQNPHVIKKVSKIRELIWDLYFSNYFLAKIILRLSTLTRRLTARKDYLEYKEGQQIHMGYGACYVLGPLFFQHFKMLWAPTFLMGEEFFISEQIRMIGFRIFYEPSLKVHHHDHSTMGKLPSKRLWEITRHSHRIYRKFVNPYKWHRESSAQPSDLADCWQDRI